MSDRRPLELADLYDLRRVGNPTLSPDGERVAFTVSEADEDEDTWHQSLFVAPSDGSRDPHRLTRVPGVGSPKWSPDGSALAFIARRDEDVSRRVGTDDDDGDEKGAEGDDEEEDGEGEIGNGEDRPQVWTFDLERGGDARQVTDFEEGVREFDWGPAGDRLVASARDPTDEEREYLESRREDDGPIVTERLQHKRDGQGWLDSVTTYLFVVDAETGEATRLDEAYGGGASESAMGLCPAWSPEGQIAFLSNRTDRPDDSRAMDVYTVAPDGTDLGRLTDGDLTAGGLRWSPDGERLAFGASSATNAYETTDLYLADPDSGDFRSISESLDRTVRGIEWADDEVLLASVGDEGRTRLVRFRANGDPERVYDRQGDYRTVRGFDVAGDTVALTLSSPDSPREVYAFSTDEIDARPDDPDPARQVSALNEDLRSGIETPTCERVTFENSDGEVIEGIVYLPESFSARNSTDSESLPLIVNVHGGPTAYDSPSFGFKETYWTGRGYAVLEVNYRGSTSYGQAFSEQIRADWGPRESDDIVSGTRALVERGWADPDRLFVTGFSQGGINTLYVITRTDEFAAAAPEHGIYDFRALYGTADTQLWYANDLGLPWENPENYRRISSIQDVGEVETPTLVTAGEEDWRCPPWQAEQLYVSLKKRGVPSKLVTYPGEHHNVGDPERAIHRLRTLTEWFERHDPEIDPSTADE